MSFLTDLKLSAALSKYPQLKNVPRETLKVVIEHGSITTLNTLQKHFSNEELLEMIQKIPSDELEGILSRPDFEILEFLKSSQ